MVVFVARHVRRRQVPARRALQRAGFAEHLGVGAVAGRSRRGRRGQDRRQVGPIRRRQIAAHGGAGHHLDRQAVAARRRPHRIAGRRLGARQAHLIGREARIGPVVVGRHILRPAGEGGGAARDVGGPGLHRVGVGAGPHDEALAHGFANARLLAHRIVQRQIGGGGAGLVGVDEQDPALQRRPALGIGGDFFRPFVQGEEDLAARGAQRGPSACHHSLAQGGAASAHLIGRDQMSGLEHRADFRIQRIPGRRVEVQRRDPARHRGRTRLGVQQDQDRRMIGMGRRPVANLRQTGDEGQATAAEIHVGHMQHLEPRPRHRLLKGRTDRRAGSGPPQRRQRVGVAPALRIVQHVDLQLARAGVQLFGERSVGVVQPRRARIDRRHRRQLRLGNGQLVGVVGADGGDVVHPQRPVHPDRRAGVAPCSAHIGGGRVAGGRGEKQGGEKGAHDRSPWTPPDIARPLNNDPEPRPLNSRMTPQRRNRTGGHPHGSRRGPGDRLARRPRPGQGASSPQIGLRSRRRGG